MNYVNFCKNYYAVNRIPVSLMHKDQPVHSAMGERLGLKPTKTYQVFWELDYAETNPSFCRYSPNIEYGWIHVEGTDYHIVIGPAFSIPVSDGLIREYMRENAIPLGYKETVAEFLSAIPLLTHQQFAMHLSLLHMSLNGKEIEPSRIFDPKVSNAWELGHQHTEKIMSNMENNSLHNSYHFEQSLWEHIKNGDTDKLKDFLSSTPVSLTEGRLANTPLRHAKNLFIKATVSAGMLGAIPGGADVEQTYQLIDLYIQECEQLQSIDAVKSLQYSMIVDFCERAGETRIPDGISSEVYNCINYIRSHVGEPITIEDVAEQIHRSTSHAMRHFKDELGINMGAFIMRCKLEEARSLLTYTDKTLSEISSYLCFSSQSHFQNVFKKKYGITPLQYRRQRQRA